MRPPLVQLRVTQLFGGNQYNEAYISPLTGKQIIGHDGIDFAANIGDLIYPACTGYYEVIDQDTGFGLHVILHGDDGRQVLYGHLSGVSVRNGDKAQLHIAFGAAGSSGNSTGPHVHFLLKPKSFDINNGYDGAIDPLPYFDHDVYPHLNVGGV